MRSRSPVVAGMLQKNHPQMTAFYAPTPGAKRENPPPLRYSKLDTYPIIYAISFINLMRFFGGKLMPTKKLDK